MTNQHYKFPHIEQLRNVLINLKHQYQNPVSTTDGWVFDETIKLPIIDFYGTVKLHGTNGAIIIDPVSKTKYAQSREKTLSVNNDNYGFYQFVDKIDINKLLDHIIPVWKISRQIKIFGEWCGKGIQAGVGISQLPKMFVVFAVQVGDYWVPSNELKLFNIPDENIFSIFRVPEWTISINFDDINKDNNSSIIEQLSLLTEEVEKECPFAKSFGVSGIGEGIVWRSYSINSFNNEPYMFKTKGLKHKNVKEKSIVQLVPEKLENLSELISSVVTEQRLNQGIEKLKEMGYELSKKSTGHFLKWIQDDINRENKDMLETSGIDIKNINSEIQRSAKEWFFKNIGVN